MLFIRKDHRITITRQRSDDQDLFERLLRELGEQENFRVVGTTKDKDLLRRPTLIISFRNTIDGMFANHWIEDHFEV